MNSTNIITSLNVNTQLPLDHKTYVYNENSLLDLGLNQTKAFSYYVGMKVYCVLQNKTYIWREYLTPLELNGLIPNGFIYPNGILNTDYNYSNKKFNFFIYEIDELNNKVDKVIGKSLLADTEITRLLTMTAIFTTALKSAYDNAVTWITTNGTNLINHLSNISNPHGTTAVQVGLGNVNNTNDLSKPISTATQTALDLKIEKNVTQIRVNTSTTIDVSWNGAIVIITTAGVVLTVPATLPANFTFDAITRPNATCNFALTIPKTWVNGTPTIVSEKSTFVFVVDSLNSNEIYLIK